jgi:putative flippase GtrA/ubiquinone/menaquinone biosynthesis C-methylase UbiE
MTLASIAVVIPAYEPTQALIELVDALSQMGFLRIVVVDDGSGPPYAGCFQSIAGHHGVVVLKHFLNLGKGAALKTGLNHVLCDLPGAAAVVTADADGQHHPDDIRRVAAAVAAQGQAVVLGARQFQGATPLRSRIGNAATRRLFGLVVGRHLTDTQTGLRGIPIGIVPDILRIEASGYEFELDVLLLCKHQRVPVSELSIRTIYSQGNASSHFNPLFDSMRIWFVLLRFSMLSLLTALIDNVVFVVAFRATNTIVVAQVIGRLVAVVVNYAGSRRAVFFSREAHRRVLPRYLLLVAASGIVSYALIRFLTESFAMSVVSAKLLAESTLFIANFTIQRDFVFTRPAGRSLVTDWDEYYSSVPATAKLTRKYTGRVLLTVLRMVGLTEKAGRGTIVEIGGANSCFVDRIVAAVRPASYHVVDTNRFGLELLRARLGAANGIVLHEQDVRQLSLPLQADVVFSVGLIEHFDEGDTRKAVQSHFRLLKPGGYAIISFPTPTWLYRVSRSACELVGLWKFHDERPLRRMEVARAVGDLGQIVFEKTMWPVWFTQHLMVFRKIG